MTHGRASYTLQHLPSSHLPLLQLFIEHRHPTDMWERTLQDLIRGLRAHKSSPRGELEAFLGECVEEIRGELRGREMDLKAEGVVKMCYVSRTLKSNE